MNCPLGNQEHAEMLMAYSSRKLDAIESARVEQHVAECAECREFVHGQQAVWAALDAWEPAPVSADFNRRLYQRIETQGSWWDRLMLPFRQLAVHKSLSLVAAAGLVLAIGVVLNETAAPPPQNTSQSTVKVADKEGLQPDQVVKALDEMEALSRFDRLMKPETPESQM
jgi:anti-sigma factor RsiW